MKLDISLSEISDLQEQVETKLSEFEKIHGKIDSFNKFYNKKVTIEIDLDNY